jgi:hypothetical protein
MGSTIARVAAPVPCASAFLAAARSGAPAFPDGRAIRLASQGKTVVEPSPFAKPGDDPSKGFQHVATIGGVALERCTPIIEAPTARSH